MLKKIEETIPFNRLTKLIDVARALTVLCSEESGLMTVGLIDCDKTVNGWHCYSAYDASILDDRVLGEWTNLFPKVFFFQTPKFELNYLLLNT